MQQSTVLAAPAGNTIKAEAIFISGETAGMEQSKALPANHGDRTATQTSILTKRLNSSVTCVAAIQTSAHAKAWIAEKAKAKEKTASQALRADATSGATHSNRCKSRAQIMQGKP